MLPYYHEKVVKRMEKHRSSKEVLALEIIVTIQNVNGKPNSNGMEFLGYWRYMTYKKDIYY